MRRFIGFAPLVTLLVLPFLVFHLLGCGSGSGLSSPNQPQSTSSAAIVISPTSSPAGTSTLSLTITGTDFIHQGDCASCANSVVVWTSGNGSDRLATTFVSDTQLSATVPANLLSVAGTAKITVETWVGGESSPRSMTKAAFFSIMAPGGPTISSISPASATAGSSDLTLTIDGSNFDNRFLHQTVAFWTTDPTNLHDHGNMLNTTFVSNSRVTAVIPASLLQSPAVVKIVILVGDSMGMSDGFFGYPESNAVEFSVTP